MLVSFILLGAQGLLVIASVALFVFACACLPGSVPYVVSRQHAIDAAVDVLDLQPDDIFYDIGSGDGRTVLAAHRSQRAARCIGIEIQLGWHLLALYARRTAGSPKAVQFRRGNFYSEDFSDATKVYAFLSPSVMKSFETLCEQKLKNATLVSSDFPLPTRAPVRILDLYSPTHDTLSRKLYVYRY